MRYARILAIGVLCVVALAAVGCGNKGNTPLHQAAKTGTQADLEAALGNGADINKKNNDHNTPLHEAAESGNIVAVEFLIQHGADLNARDEDGDTPLHFAAEPPARATRARRAPVQSRQH